MAGQWLHRPGPVGARDVVGHLLAVQAQDERAAALALRARGAPWPRWEDGLCVTWLLRGTLHLVRVEDLPWLWGLCAPRQLAASVRRCAQLGIGEDRAEAAGPLLAEAAPIPRARARELLDADGQELAHLLWRAALRGWVVLAPDRSVQDGRPLLRDAPAGALGDLATRGLRARPGAGPRDLARWSGLALGDARRALRDARVSPPPEPVRTGTVLLGAYDELLLGWVDRTATVPPALERAVFPGGGVLRPVVLRDGAVVGTWGLRDGRVTTTQRGATREARDVAGFVARGGNEAHRT